MEKKQAMWMYPRLHGFNPPERWGHSACYSHGSLYIFGGCCGGLHFSDVLVLDLQTMSWTAMETRGQAPGPRDSHSAVILGRRMIVFGGTNGRNKVNDLHVLDLDTKEWIIPQCIGNPPSPRESHTATIIGGSKMVIFGGSGEGESNYLNDLHVLDLERMVWVAPEVKGEVPVPRDSHCAVEIGESSNKLLVFGGDRGDRYHGDVDLFDMDSLTWSKLVVDGCSPGVRAGHAAVSIGTKVLVIGGVGDKNYYNDVWVLDTANSCSWTRLDVCGHHQPQGRFSHTAVVTPFDIVVYGGCGEDERPLNELLLLNLGAHSNNLGHKIIQQKPFWMRSADTINPKRKRMMNSNASARCWEVVESPSQQEEHSLSLSQHSSPSLSDQEQASTKKRAASDSLSSLFKQINPPPTRIHHRTANTNDVPSTRNMMERAISYNAAEQQFFRRKAMLLSPLDQQKPMEQQNLIGAEVRGKVDGLFDSGLLMTANVNGRILRGVLFPAAPMVGNGVGGWLSSSPSTTTTTRGEFSTRVNQNRMLHRLPSSSSSHSLSAYRNQNQNHRLFVLSNKPSEEAGVGQSRVMNRGGGVYYAESQGSSPATTTVTGSGGEKEKKLRMMDHLEGVVLTLGGPGSSCGGGGS
ncbi:unnamed protein product [Linum trigynum]|uniref:Uncharacterized protein n=1 Tax=Linum trigynum TaxID=586398 RepID=A0AAV2GBI7_9ROSI